MNKHRNGFAVVEVLVILVVLVAVGAAGFFVMNKNKDKEKNSGQNQSNSTNTSAEKSTREVKIKHLGVELAAYDPATNMAGDFKFTKATFAAGEKMQRLFMDYGFVIPSDNRADGKALANPQPTFILPLGTKVHSLVDGTVYDVPKLYSGDYSVHVQGEGSDLIFETEHVINVLVKKGDKVKAGDVIAEVSDYDAKGYAGLGLVEIGVLKGGNPPSHLCPFDYLDDSIKEETLKNITALKKAWEEYRGDSTIYDEANELMPGCVNRDPVEG